jgi:acetoin utilization deacetylase AcuC-like enzyme
MPTELERRARELLAAELDREADSGESRNIIRIADMVREGVPVRSGFVEAALRAIAAALQARDRIKHQATTKG